MWASRSWAAAFAILVLAHYIGLLMVCGLAVFRQNIFLVYDVRNGAIFVDTQFPNAESKT